jgi:GAF domain-containing protein
MKLSIFNLHRPAPTPGDEHKTPSGAPRAISYIIAGSKNLGLQVNQFASQLLKTLLVASSSLGILLYLLNLPGMIANGQWVTLAVFGLVCLGLIVLTGGALMGERFSNPRYAVLATGYLTLLLVAGVGMLLTDGWYGNGRVLLVVLPLLAAFLFGSGSLASFVRLTALVSSIAVVAIIGLFVGYGQDPVIKPLPDTSTLLNWTMMVGGFSLVALVCALALNAYLRVLENSLKNSEQIAQGFDQEHQRLENQIQQRTNDLERRLAQIRSVSEIIKSISVVGEHSDPSGAAIPDLLQRVCDLVKEQFSLYYVGVFLIEPSASGPDSAVLAAGTGEAGQKLLAEGYRLQVGDDSVIGWATANRKARVARNPRSPDDSAEIAEIAPSEPTLSDPALDDIASAFTQAGPIASESEALRFTNPYLPETRSELALPVLSQQAVIGALTIQSESEEAFDQDDILVIQGIADALANAIENERLFAQTQADLAEIQALHRQYLRRAWDQYLSTQAGGDALAQEYMYQSKHLTASQAAASQPSASVKNLALPIRLRGMPIGSLNLGIAANRTFTTEELAFINSVIDQAAVALENARLLDETRQRAEQEKVAARISSKVWASTDIDTILRTALKELGTALDASEAVIELWPE